MTHSLILTIDFDKEARGNYVARAEVGGVLVTEPNLYDGISTAIRQEALNIPPGFAHFLEFTYNGMSTGTYAVGGAKHIDLQPNVGDQRRRRRPAGLTS